MSKLLINEYPLQLLPTLAVWVGLNEAIALQQLHYWLENHKVGETFTDGRKYVRNTLGEWRSQNFPWWSIGVIRRTFNNLVNDGLVLETHELNKHGYDKTKWYAIHYENLDALTGPVARVFGKKKGQNSTPCQNDTPPYQNERGGYQNGTIHHTKIASSIVSKCDHGESQNGTTIPEIKREKEDVLFSQIDFSAFWAQTLEQIGGELTKAVFNQHFGTSRWVDVDGGTAVIEVSNQYSADWINGRLKEIVSRNLNAVTGECYGVHARPERLVNHAAI